MSKRIVTLVIKTDDITGEDIPEGQGESFVYAWDGSEWEIDLNEKNANDIREMMGRLTEASRKLGRYRPSVQMPRRTTPAITNPTHRELPQGEMSQTATKNARTQFLREIRTWAQANGFPEQKMTGRIIEGVREAWSAAHPDRPAPTEDTFVK